MKITATATLCGLRKTGTDRWIMTLEADEFVGGETDIAITEAQAREASPRLFKSVEIMITVDPPTP